MSATKVGGLAGREVMTFQMTGELIRTSPSASTPAKPACHLLSIFGKWTIFNLRSELCYQWSLNSYSLGEKLPPQSLSVTGDGKEGNQ